MKVKMPWSKPKCVYLKYMLLSKSLAAVGHYSASIFVDM